MKSVACMSSSVRAACQHTSACFPLGRGVVPFTRAGRLATRVDSVNRAAVVVQQPCVTGARTFHGTHVNTAVVQQVSAAPIPTLVTLPEKTGDELAVYRFGGRLPAVALPSPYSPYTRPQSRSSVDVKSLIEGDVIPELCSRLADLPRSDRAEGLATLLGACAEFGLDTRSPLVRILMDESLQLLRHGDIGLAQLCHLGEVAHALEGRSSAVLTEVLNSISMAVREDTLTPGEAVGVYSLLARCHNPACQRESRTLSILHRQTERLVHRLRAGQVSDILQLLLKFQQKQVGRAATHRPPLGVHSVHKGYVS